MGKNVYLEMFSESCKKESLEIFKSHSGKDSIEFIDGKNSPPNTQNNWSSFIFVGGSKFRCMFAAEFSTIALLSLASERFTDINEADYIKNVKDFMREYCNLFAGKLKACFEKETDAYLSLPIITRDYDIENLFGNSLSEIENTNWSFGENNMKVNIELFYYAKEQFESYDFINNHLQKQEQTDEIDFF